MSEEQKNMVLNIGIDYIKENYSVDYSLNGEVEVGHYLESRPEGDIDYNYPVASFRVPSDMQQSGLFVNVMVDLETGDVVKVCSSYSKSDPPPLLDEPTIPEVPGDPEPNPKEPFPMFEYELEVDFESAEGFTLSKLEDVNRNIQTLLVLHPIDSGTITVTLVSTGTQDYELSLSLELSGQDSEFQGVEYSFNPSVLFLRSGGQNSSILQIGVNADAPTGHYEISLMAMTELGGLGFGFPALIVAPFTTEFLYTVKTSGPNIFPPGWTPPESEILTFELKPGNNISVLIFIMDSIEPLDLNVTAPSTIDFELKSDVVEIFGQTPEPDKFYQLNLKSNPETPESAYTIILNGSTGSFSFQRNLILNVQNK